MSIASQLIVHGWCQGTFEEEDGSLCLAGAAAMAEGREPPFLLPSRSTLELLGQYTFGEPINWNDVNGRTFDEVLAVAKMVDEELGW